MPKDYNSGKPAENFFKHVIAPVDFNQPIEDLRENHIEGDFAFGQVYKYVVEVKGDYVAFRDGNPTGRLPIEIKNTANIDGEGWFTHCQADKVKDIYFICYDGENKFEPVCSIRVPLVTLVPYVTAKLKDDLYMRRHYFPSYSKDKKTGKTETAWNLCVPLEELYKHCGATVATARAKNADVRKWLQSVLKSNGISGVVGEYAHISFSEEDRMGGLPR